MFYSSLNRMPTERKRTREGDILLAHHFKMIKAFKQFKQNLTAGDTNVINTRVKCIDMVDSIIKLLTHFNQTLPFSYNGTYALTAAQRQFLQQCYETSHQTPQPFQNLCATLLQQNSYVTSMESALMMTLITEHNRHIDRANFFLQYHSAAAHYMAAFAIILGVVSIIVIMKASAVAAITLSPWFALLALSVAVLLGILLAPDIFKRFADTYRKAEDIIQKDFLTLRQQIEALQPMLHSTQEIQPIEGGYSQFLRLMPH